VNATIEPLRAAGKLGKSLDAAVTLTGSPDDAAYRILEKHRDFLPELLIVSHVTLAPVTGAPLAASVRPCSELGHVRCPRCWRWVPALDPSSPQSVCPRCAEALST
jgi:isoleucyl-tRNA synthetase